MQMHEHRRESYAKILVMLLRSTTNKALSTNEVHGSVLEKEK